MSAAVCPFKLCDGSGFVETEPAHYGPSAQPSEGFPCRCAEAPPDPWNLAPTGLNPDEAPLQLDPDPNDEPDTGPEETPW